MLLVIGLAVAALAASVYLVFVLEILKFKRVRMRQLQTLEPTTSAREIDARVRQEFETGEFERVG